MDTDLHANSCFSLSQEFIDARLVEGVAYPRVVYVGDGTNDLCPALELGGNDVLMPRQVG